MACGHSGHQRAPQPTPAHMSVILASGPDPSRRPKMSPDARYKPRLVFLDVAEANDAEGADRSVRVPHRQGLQEARMRGGPGPILQRRHSGKPGPGRPTRLRTGQAPRRCLDRRPFPPGLSHLPARPEPELQACRTPAVCRAVTRQDPAQPFAAKFNRAGMPGNREHAVAIAAALTSGAASAGVASAGRAGAPPAAP